MYESGERPLQAEERAKVVQLGREARKRDVGPAFAASWAQTYIALESTASHLQLYAEELLPGLLQTEDYARAILEEGGFHSRDEIEYAAASRSERQQRLAVIRASELPVMWRKSSRSQNGANNCVEVGRLENAIAVRDSKDPEGYAFVCARKSWSAFLAAVKADRLGH